jgi:hypothetical protein
VNRCVPTLSSREPDVDRNDDADTRSDAAEAVRSHLIHLRGGSPFLSSTETDLLEQWFESGFSVAVILHALDRAADARAKRPTRTPFTLDRARRYLQPAEPKPPRAATQHGDASSRSWAARARDAYRHDTAHSAILTLIDQIQDAETQEPTTCASRVAGALAAFHEARWEQLDERERDALMKKAREDFEDLAALMPPAALEESILERARALLRSRYALLTMANVLPS